MKKNLKIITIILVLFGASVHFSPSSVHVQFIFSPCSVLLQFIVQREVDDAPVQFVDALR